MVVISHFSLLASDAAVLDRSSDDGEKNNTHEQSKAKESLLSESKLANLVCRCKNRCNCAHHNAGGR